MLQQWGQLEEVFRPQYLKPATGIGETATFPVGNGSIPLRGNHLQASAAIVKPPNSCSLWSTVPGQWTRDVQQTFGFRPLRQAATGGDRRLRRVCLRAICTPNAFFRRDMAHCLL